MFVRQEQIIYQKGDKFKTHSLFYEYIFRRVNKSNKNFVLLVEGGTGSGKSWTCLRMANDLDPDFNIDRVVFSVKDFLDLLGNPEANGLKRGSVIIFEEAGVGMSNRRFMSNNNVNFNVVLQTFRHKNYILIMNTPSFTLVDAASRKLVHCVTKMLYINTVKNYSRVLNMFKTDMSFDGKTHNKFMRTGGCNLLNSSRIRGMKILPPPMSLVKEYEKKKTQFTTGKYQQLHGEMSDSKPKKESKVIVPNKLELDERLVWLHQEMKDNPNLEFNKIIERAKGRWKRGSSRVTMFKLKAQMVQLRKAGVLQ